MFVFVAGGVVFRVSPNELSFSSVRSWKDVYGPRPDQACFPKSDFYDIFGAGFKSGCIGSERDPVRHSQMKRLLAPAFSRKALAEQEDIVQGCIDAFIAKMKTTGTPATKETGLNMTVWFEMLAFDILGEMAFGESFHCVEAGQPHPWQQMIASHLFLITVVDNLRRYPVARWLGMKLLPPLTKGVQERHTKYSRDKIASRMTSCAPRKDFLSDIIERTKAGELSTEELTAHASTLVIAGGETVAAFLAAVTFYLCKTPLVLRRLQQEIRTSFPTYALIHSSRALQLPYLQAVIREGLRIYPPSPQGLPRVSPGAAVDGCWVPKGVRKIVVFMCYPDFSGMIAWLMASND
ncbi:MAG: hypothetical protein LQ339_005378 [Xanthoria mediterranea]|nr:MAG: hypothetical protein LQ339_005378 [Xanthoria mediterranea]